MLKLSHIDDLSAILSEHSVRMLPVNIPGDMAAADSPIKGILMLDRLVWMNLLKDNSSNANIRQWQADALKLSFLIILLYVATAWASVFNWIGDDDLGGGEVERPLPQQRHGAGGDGGRNSSRINAHSRASMSLSATSRTDAGSSPTGASSERVWPGRRFLRWSIAALEAMRYIQVEKRRCGS